MPKAERDLFFKNYIAIQTKQLLVVSVYPSLKGLSYALHYLQGKDERCTELCTLYDRVWVRKEGRDKIEPLLST